MFNFHKFIHNPVCSESRQDFRRLPAESKLLASFATRVGLLAVVFSLCLPHASEARAQTTITSFQPRTVPPNQTSRITIAGTGLDANLRLATTHPSIRAQIVEVEPTRATIDLTTTAATPLGPGGLLTAADSGPLNPLIYIVDDLPLVVDNGVNHSLETAQSLPPLAAVEGLVESLASDFYRVELAENQRLAIEVRTQELGSAVDPVLRIWDQAGKLLGEFDDDEVGPEVRLAYRSPVAQSVVLEVFDSRSAVGGQYHLRVGDFPLPGHPLPLTVRAGTTTEVQFLSSEEATDDHAKPQTITIPPAHPGGMIQVAARAANSQSSTWQNLLVRPFPQHVQLIDQTPEPLPIPAGISGHFGQSNETDSWPIQGIAGTTVRFQSYTRSLGCATLLRMRLLNADGNSVAETAVGPQDEWSFDFAFPDAGVYQLIVNDLLGRGGDRFGYYVDVVPAGNVSVALKADAATVRDFSLEPDAGAAAIDLQLTRFGYDGPLRIDFADPVPGLRLLNPIVPASVPEAKVYLQATAGWEPQSLAAVKLIATLPDHPDHSDQPIAVEATALERIKQPHLIHGQSWRGGDVFATGVPAGEPFFTVKPASKLLFAANQIEHAFELQVDRVVPEFQGEVRLMGNDANALPNDWVLTSTTAGNVVQGVIKRGSATGSRPTEIQLAAFGQHGPRGRIETIVLPIEWIEDIDVYPAEVTLTNRKQRRQFVVTEWNAAVPSKDRTREANLTSSDPAIAEIVGTAVFPKANGTAEIKVELGGIVKTIPVTITGMDVPSRIDFESEVLVALSKQGCNAGACHGSPSGKGMFRLSLRAFDAKLDELTLIREDLGRRLNLIEPEKSLLLQKPLMEVAHGGGRQLRPDDEAYQIIRDWIAEGAKPDPAETARCVRLEVLPGEKRIQKLVGGGQQVAAIAHFSDGTTRDVTHLAAYESSNNQVATVNHRGYVTATGRGDAAILVRFLEHIESIPMMFIEDVEGFQWHAPTPANYVDELVQAKLKQLQYLPSPTCDDSDFVRRVYLDVIGSLPTVEETRVFLADEAADKRVVLIDQLLDRDEFAKFWALKWGDYLKMTRTLVGDDGIYKYYRWVETAFRENMPYDTFVRALLTASGSTLANPAANFYRTTTDMNDRVETVSQVFLGARLQCAKCHNHPFERWTQDNYFGMGAFFNRVENRTTGRPGETFVWSRQVGEVTQPRTGQQVQPWLPQAGYVEGPLPGDRRDEFADWLTAADNPFLARVEANRIWSHLFSRGIVDPIDDFRDSNPPSNEPLLDALAADFVSNGFDRKHLLRTILNSQTYQADYSTNPYNETDTQYFSYQAPRLLTAEQLHDAVHDTLNLIPSFAGLRPGTKATQLPAPDIAKVEFLKVFGQPERATVCDCERVDDSNLGMAIELLNGTTIHAKLQDPANRFRASIVAEKPLEAMVEELYLAALSRYPTESELATASEYCQSRDDTAKGIEDLYWAMFNMDEFLFQH